MKVRIPYFVLFVCVIVAIPFAMGQSFRLPAGSVGNREMSNTAGNEIANEKLWHRTPFTYNFDLAIGAAPTDQEKILFQADKAGTLGDAIYASCNADGSSGSTTFDVKKNGTTVLTGVITITGGSTSDRVQIAGTFASAAAQAYAIGDVISCITNETSHTAAAGPMITYSRVEQGD